VRRRHISKRRKDLVANTKALLILSVAWVCVESRTIIASFLWIKHTRPQRTKRWRCLRRRKISKTRWRREND
jgi:hypothetical protein